MSPHSLLAHSVGARRVALLLAVVGMAACHLPARRAARLEPSVALRQE